MNRPSCIASVLVIVASSTITAFGASPNTCRQGYVWREAYPGDYVCVSPEVRAQAAGDNSQSNARRAPGGGPSGPDTCLSGFVWREARPEDHVCVTPQVHAQAASDNSQAAARRADTRSRPANANTGNLSDDVEGWNQYGFGIAVHRSNSWSDLIFTWQVRPPNRYDAFNVRVRVSDGREGQVEVPGGNHGSYTVRNAEVGKTYTFLVQGCNKGTFSSTCTEWSQLSVLNDRNLR
jgi:hypothetical protein